MASITTNFPPDLIITAKRGGWTNNFQFLTRLIANGASTAKLVSSSTAVESTSTADCPAFVDNVSYDNNTGSSTAGDYVGYAFRRAPGFFDVVCYAGVTSTLTLNHNLGVPPELVITKSRTSSAVPAWYVAGNPLTGGFPGGNILQLNTTAAETYQGYFSNPTSTTLFLQNPVARNGTNYVAYLFATVPNVSKVGSYTGTGGTQTINAGLPTGARFVLIKRTNSTGNWWVWDTARGMVSGTDPRLALNSTAAELNNNWVYTIANGFQIVTTDATINASGGSYLYLAIA